MVYTRRPSDQRCEEIYAYITEYVAENGHSPTFREVGKAVGLRSSSTVSRCPVTKLSLIVIIARAFAPILAAFRYRAHASISTASTPIFDQRFQVSGSSS